MAINIIAAVYGTTRAGMDVTARCQEIVNTGNDDIEVNNENMGGDPEHGVQKSFGIIYTLPNGQTLCRACQEGQGIDLVQ